MTERVSSYSVLQILLHWFVAFGMVFQIAFHEPMVRATEAASTGSSIDPSDAVWASLHVVMGSLIFVAVLVRLALRLLRGAPAHPSGSGRAAELLASLVHGLLYVLLLAIVVTGTLTHNAVADLGTVHWALNVAIVILVVGHVAAAIYNQFVREDGTLGRMIPLLNATNAQSELPMFERLQSSPGNAERTRVFQNS